MRYVTGAAAILAMVLLVGCSGGDLSTDAGEDQGTPEYPDSDSTNIIQLHLVDSPLYDANCLASNCHADVLGQKSADPTIPHSHGAMLPFVPGYSADSGPRNENCIYCHSNTQLIMSDGSTARRDGSAGNLRRNVDVGLCAQCHGPSGPGKQFYN